MRFKFVEAGGGGGRTLAITMMLPYISPIDLRISSIFLGTICNRNNLLAIYFTSSLPFTCPLVLQNSINYIDREGSYVQNLCGEYDHKGLQIDKPDSPAWQSPLSVFSPFHVSIMWHFMSFNYILPKQKTPYNTTVRAVPPLMYVYGIRANNKFYILNQLIDSTL